MNERFAQSTQKYRLEESGKIYPDMLKMVCGANGVGGKYPFKETTKGANKWGFLESSTNRSANIGAVYRRFTQTLKYVRNILNPLYLRLCHKKDGEPCLPSGWQQQDMIDALKYNLALKKVPVDLEDDTPPAAAEAGPQVGEPATPVGPVGRSQDELAAAASLLFAGGVAGAMDPTPQGGVAQTQEGAHSQDGAHTDREDGSPALVADDILTGKQVKAAIAADGVKENAHFPFLLAWIELGPLGADDSHFAINPPAPCLPQAATTPAAADTTPGAETANVPPKPSSRSQQRQQEAKRANAGVEEALKKAAKTGAACVADEAAHREAYEVAAKAHKALVKQHQMDIQQKRELFMMADDDSEEKNEAKKVYRLALGTSPPSFEDVLEKVKHATPGESHPNPLSLPLTLCLDPNTCAGRGRGR